MPDPTRSPQSFFAGYLQFDVQLGDIAANLSRINKGLARLGPHSPGIICLPELWATGFAYRSLPELALRTPDVLAALQELAAQYRIFLAGSLPERATNHAAIYNTLYVTGPDGTIGSYRKQHLFSPMQEDKHLRPGDNPQPIDTPLGRLAGMVCYDLRFPELARFQAAQGSNLLLISAQWPLIRKDHWRTLIKARAIENQIFVIAANRCGTDAVAGGTTYAGHSMVVAPNGEVLIEAGEQEEQNAIHLDTTLLDTVRARFNTVAPKPYRFHDRDKIMDLKSILEAVKRDKRLGKKVVFTNGCFDILHAGHVAYLEVARQQGDCLIVGLNSDASVRSIKGPKRPVNAQAERTRVLAGLGCVDYVVLFDEKTPLNLITTLMPDVLAKGADWSEEKIIGAAEIKAAGGRVARIPLVEGASTSALISKIKQ